MLDYKMRNTYETVADEDRHGDGSADSASHLTVLQYLQNVFELIELKITEGVLPQEKLQKLAVQDLVNIGFGGQK